MTRVRPRPANARKQEIVSVVEGMSLHLERGESAAERLTLTHIEVHGREVSGRIDRCRERRH
jgi:hypothetical protein